MCVLHSIAITFHFMSERYLSTSFYTGLDVSIISRCLFFYMTIFYLELTIVQFRCALVAISI